MISKPYEDKGISQYDRYYECYRCCHCNGLAFMGYLDKLNADAKLPHNKEEARRIVEEYGQAYQLDDAQFIHYRCGAYVGPGRRLRSEDLDLLSRSAEVDIELLETILSHYKLTHEDLRLRFMRAGGTEEDFKKLYKVDATDEEKNLVSLGIYGDDPSNYNLFNENEIRQVHERIYITEDDRNQFKLRNRNNVFVPEMSDPSIVDTLDYRELMRIQPNCVRCQSQITVNARGFRFNREDRMPKYVHFSCYNIIISRRKEEEKRLLYMSLNYSEQERMRAIEEHLGQLPIVGYNKWMADSLKNPDSWQFHQKVEQFIQFYEKGMASS